MKILQDNNLIELQSVLAKMDAPKFRAKQLFEGLMKGKNLDQINIGKELIEKLKKSNANEVLSLITKQESNDGTVKFLFKLHDNNAVETVLMKYKYGYSLCVSTQVGCRMRCSFCASGIKGLIRNLTAGEILSQVAVVNNYLNGGLGDKRKIHSVVLMGTGEPLDNYDNVVKFIKLVNDPLGLNIGTRHISLSTCGLVPQIKKLADTGLKINLTLSLHSAKDDVRGDMMPIARRYNINQVLSACNYYFEKTGRRVMLEYILIKDLTDTDVQLSRLIKLLKGSAFAVNLIRLNPVAERGYERVSDQRAKHFNDALVKEGINSTIRRTLGSDIDGACGQLRQKHIDKN